MLKSFFLNKKWALWAWGGFVFIIGSLIAQTWIDVKIKQSAAFIYKGTLLGFSFSHTISSQLNFCFKIDTASTAKSYLVLG